MFFFFFLYFCTLYKQCYINFSYFHFISVSFELQDSDSYMEVIQKNDVT